MLRGTVRKKDDGVFIEIAPEDAERAGLRDGMNVTLSIETLETRERSIDDEDFMRMVERIIEEDREALDYLAEHE